MYFLLENRLSFPADFAEPAAHQFSPIYLRLIVTVYFQYRGMYAQGESARYSNDLSSTRR